MGWRCATEPHEEPNMESEDSKDPMLMGEFEVIKELLAKHPEMREAKTLVDKMIGMTFYI